MPGSAVTLTNAGMRVVSVETRSHAAPASTAACTENGKPLALPATASSCAAGGMPWASPEKVMADGAAVNGPSTRRLQARVAVLPRLSVAMSERS